MKDFRSRKKKTRFFRSKLFFFVLVLILVLFVRSTYMSFLKKQRAETEQAKYQEQLETLEKKKADLQYDIEKLQTERGLEEEYRSRFNVVQEGETLIKIIEEE